MPVILVTPNQLVLFAFIFNFISCLHNILACTEIQKIGSWRTEESGLPLNSYIIIYSSDELPNS